MAVIHRGREWANHIGTENIGLMYWPIISNTVIIGWHTTSLPENYRFSRGQSHRKSLKKANVSQGFSNRHIPRKKPYQPFVPRDSFRVISDIFARGYLSKICFRLTYVSQNRRNIPIIQVRILVYIVCPAGSAPGMSVPVEGKIVKFGKKKKLILCINHWNVMTFKRERERENRVKIVVRGQTELLIKDGNCLKQYDQRIHEWINESEACWEMADSIWLTSIQNNNNNIQNSLC